MPDPLTLSIRLRIHGKVQGVWFRAWTVREARRLGLDGWVRNRTDGSVEAVLAGPAARVREMVGICWRGPPAARVVRIDEVAEPESGLSGFHQQQDC
jgi:acylphosphatase